MVPWTILCSRLPYYSRFLSPGYIYVLSRLLRDTIRKSIKIRGTVCETQNHDMMMNDNAARLKGNRLTRLQIIGNIINVII